MAVKRKTYYRERKNTSLPNSKKETIATPNFLMRDNLQSVYIDLNENFYLNGVKYSGPAYLKPNGSYIARTTKSNEFIELAQKNINKEKTIDSSRTLNRKTKASLQNINNQFRNNKRDDRIKKIIKGTKLPTKLGNNIRRLGRNKRG